MWFIPGLGFQLMTVITLTTGTAFLMWIGEQITERGVSNGISLLIFASIVTRRPRGIANYFAQHQGGDIQPLNMATDRWLHRRRDHGHRVLRERATTDPDRLLATAGRLGAYTAARRLTCRSR